MARAVGSCSPTRAAYAEATDDAPMPIVRRARRARRACARTLPLERLPRADQLPVTSRLSGRFRPPFELRPERTRGAHAADAKSRDFISQPQLASLTCLRVRASAHCVGARRVRTNGAERRARDARVVRARAVAIAR